MKYFVIESGILREKSRVVIDPSEYRVFEVKRRYQILANEKQTQFLIDVGLDENHRSTIVCTDMGELLHALALVRGAFPTTPRVQKSKS